MWPAILVRLCLGASISAQLETVYVVPLGHGCDGAAATSPSTQSEADAGDLSPARLICNFETFQQFESWLSQQSDPAAAVESILQGRLGLSAAYVCPHSSLMSDWALNWLFRLPVEWGREHGLTLDWAIVRDVSGHPPDFPRYMAAHGVRYLVLGQHRELKQSLPEDICNTPFWWESPDGARVLVWIDTNDSLVEQPHAPAASGPATEPVQPAQTQPVEMTQQAIRALVDRYTSRKYRFDSAMTLHGLDNGDSRAARRLAVLIEQWNGEGHKPRLVLSTPRDFFKHIEQAYGPELPVRHGAFSGQGELARLGSPTAMQRARQREDMLSDQEKPAAEDVGRLLAFWDHDFSMGADATGLLTREETITRNRQLWDMIADWPRQRNEDRPRRPRVEIEQPGARNPLRNNQLYLELLQDGVLRYEKLPKAAHLLRLAERLPDGGVRLRHRIKRDELPESARVVLAWRLDDDEFRSDVTFWTSAGPVNLTKESLSGSPPDYWITHQRFQLANTDFRPHGPFCFYRPEKPRKWLLCRVLSQNLSGRFKDGESRLSLAEGYPGEALNYEFSIDVYRPGR